MTYSTLGSPNNSYETKSPYNKFLLEERAKKEHRGIGTFRKFVLIGIGIVGGIGISLIPHNLITNLYRKIVLREDYKLVDSVFNYKSDSMYQDYFMKKDSLEKLK